MSEAERLAERLRELLGNAGLPWRVNAGAIGVNPWIESSNGTKLDGEYRRGGCILNMVAHDGEWMFSIVDVIAAITDTDRPSKYWSDLKAKMERNEGFDDISDNIGNIPLPTADGRMRAAYLWR